MKMNKPNLFVAGAVGRPRLNVTQCAQQIVQDGEFAVRFECMIQNRNCWTCIGAKNHQAIYSVKSLAFSAAAHWVGDWTQKPISASYKSDLLLRNRSVNKPMSELWRRVASYVTDCIGRFDDFDVQRGTHFGRVIIIFRNDCIESIQPLAQRPSIIRRLLFAKAEETNGNDRNQTTSAQEQNFPPSPHEPMLSWEIRSTKHEIRAKLYISKCEVNFSKFSSRIDSKRTEVRAPEITNSKPLTN
jgi:hypothetical protein